MIKQIEIIGIIAGLLTTVAHIPQCYTLYKSINLNHDVSIWTYIILLVGLALWLIYGYSLRLPSVILANCISIILTIIIIARIVYLNRLKNKD